MKENASRHAELTSVACLKKKRKLPDEQLEIPFPKQLCRGTSWGSSSQEPNKIGSDEFGIGDESDPESTNSNSFNSNSDSFMSVDDEAKTGPDCPKTPTSEEPSTSSASWAGTSSGTSLYSSQDRPSVSTSTSEPESLSTNEQHDCPEHEHERHVMEFGSNVDLGFSEYGRAEIKNYTEKELEDLLYSDRVGPGSSYILSSGRWSVNQDADAQMDGKKKMTIDKEFEQYFSMLML